MLDIVENLSANLEAMRLIDAMKDKPHLRLVGPAVAMILAATAIPIELRPLEDASIDLSLDLLDVVLNILGFVPLGFVLANLAPKRALAIASLVSLVAECSQLFAEARFFSPGDLAFNATGAAIGVFAGRPFRMWFTAVALNRITGLLAAVAGTGLIWWVALPGSSTALSNWDPEAQLAIGDELTQDRPWAGSIRELVIVPAGLAAADIRRLAAADSLDGLPIRPVLGPLAHIDVAALRGQPLLKGEALRSFRNAILAAGAFTVLARIRTDSVKQEGPARLVTYSRDTTRRNFTLAQHQQELVFRVRTPTSGENGMNPELATGSMLQPDREVFVAAGYDGRVSRVFVNGHAVGRLNLAAAGKPARALADLHLPLTAVAVGSLAGVCCLGCAGAGTRFRRLLLAGGCGLAGGALLWAAGGASALPEYALWLPALGLAGGLVIGTSAVDPLA